MPARWPHWPGGGSSPAKPHPDAVIELNSSLSNEVHQSLEQRRLFVPSLQQLATGQPVELQRLAALAGMPVDQTLALLRQMPGEWDPSGTRLVGWG